MGHRLEFVYGFHGCRKSVANALLSGRDVMLSSDNDYDWLGSGIYFWEEAPARAFLWARRKFGNDASVIGAKIRLGRCLNLMDVEAYAPLRDTYEVLKASGRVLPVNTPHYHRLDCLVINTAMEYAEKVVDRPYDTVRCPFAEGHPVFPDSRLFDLSHIQIAVRRQEALEDLFAVDARELRMSF